MAAHIQSLDSVNPSHTGFNIYLRAGANHYPLLRVEFKSKVDDDMSDPRIKAQYEDAHNAGAPWFPKSELSLYIKTPIGALYETNGVVSRIELLGGDYEVKSRSDSINKIFNPYLSWHGGIEVVEARGTISLRGQTSGDSHTHRIYNQAPAIAKDSLAGNYNPVAAVVLPNGIISLPASHRLASSKSQEISIDAYTTTFERTQPITEPDAVILDRSLIANSGSAQLTFLVHHPGPLHASRFNDSQKSQWLANPITFSPAENVPLAISLLITPVQTEISLGSYPFIFIGYSTSHNQNLIFATSKVS